MWRRTRLLLLVGVLLTLSACIAPITPPPTTQQSTTEASATATPVAEEESTSGETTNLVIATGGTGGVFYPYGEGLANILTAKLPNTQATVLETGGSVDNMKLIQSGEAQIGLSTVDSAYDAVNGSGAYAESGAVPAQAIAVLYQSFLHVVANGDSGITSVADMAGKNISVGAAGSSTAVAAGRVLEAAGLDPVSDVTRQELSVADSVSALEDGSIDAFFWIGGLPTAAMSDLTSSADVAVTFIDISEYLPALVESYGPVYSAYTLPQATYAGLTADVPGIGIGNILFVNQDMSEESVYALLTTIFDYLDEVHAVHPEAQKLNLEAAVVGSSIDFHPGAIKFYTEKGVWQE
jgi:uncharacterized protein